MTHRDPYRTEIESRWKAEIGEAFVQNEIELAEKMRDISNYVVDFVIDCKKILQSYNLPHSNDSISQHSNASTSRPNFVEKQIPPTHETQTPQSRSAANVQTKQMDSNLPKKFVASKLDSSFSHFEESLPFASFIAGTNEQVNKDRLFMIFGKCWKSDLNLDVTRAIIDENSASASSLICKSIIYPFKAVCLLPNPDWLMNEQKEWESFNDFKRIILHLRSQLPGTVIMIATYPIESGTNRDPFYCTFNLELLRLYNKPEANYRIFKTIDLLPNIYDAELYGEKRHYLSDDLSTQMMRELSDRLATFDSNFDDDDDY